MKLSATRAQILNPLQSVIGVVERRQTMPILANVLLEHKDGGLFVTATDLEMQITAHAELAGKEGEAVTVGARKLQDLLRALPDDSMLNVEASAKVGAAIAERAKKAGVEECYFDRGGFLFHGKIKALADAAREGGLKF